MTVGIMVKVYDGIVLAADSATTITLGNGSHQVYNSANKIFHLHRRFPVGAMTWGLGNIGSASISTLAKDLRVRLMGQSPAHEDWRLRAESYTVEGVARRLTDLMFPLYREQVDAAQDDPLILGFLVAGFSSGQSQSEAWQVQFDSSMKEEPEPLLVAGPEVSGWATYAQPEAVTRLFNGMDPQMLALVANFVPEDKQQALQEALRAFQTPVTPPAMPLADAVALARFMADVTAGYAHYRLGPDTVGGPVEVAAMSRHEGFKWVERKHYYSPRLNPEVTDHADQQQR